MNGFKLTETLNRRLLNLWPWIMHASTTYSADPFLVAAIAWQESNFNPQATHFEANYYRKYCLNLPEEKIRRYNPAVDSIAKERKRLATAWGAMQIVGLTAREKGYRKPKLESLCGEDGVRMGTIYLMHQLNRYGNDIGKAVSAYNAGSSIQSNIKSYVTPVLERYRILRQELHDNPAFGE